MVTSTKTLVWTFGNADKLFLTSSMNQHLEHWVCLHLTLFLNLCLLITLYLLKPHRLNLSDKILTSLIFPKNNAEWVHVPIDLSFWKKYLSPCACCNYVSLYSYFNFRSKFLSLQHKNLKHFCLCLLKTNIVQCRLYMQTTVPRLLCSSFLTISKSYQWILLALLHFREKRLSLNLSRIISVTSEFLRALT